jgi:hypothetical protein
MWQEEDRGLIFSTVSVFGGIEDHENMNQKMAGLLLPAEYMIMELV